MPQLQNEKERDDQYMNYDLNKVTLEITAGNISQLPKNNLPQVVFSGKSNVGKSSLINSMLNRKSLARTSNSPGKTQTINFYNIQNKLYFVDLPGYGYARAPKNKIKSWSNLIEKYLTNNKAIRLFLLLVDIRHEPTSNDKLIYDWLRFYDFNTVIVATKSDKIKSNHIDSNLDIIKKKLESQGDVLPFSRQTRLSRDELWRIINNGLSV